MDLSYVPYKEIQRALGASNEALDRTRLFATLCRINTLYMIQRAGSGHIGSSFSAMDIVAWLHLNEMQLPADPDGEGDVYFSSKGHDAPGLYSVMLGLGRLDFDLVHTLRRAGGLPGHPDRETPGILTNTGSLGMGISKAKGMIVANRLQGRSASIYVLTGDGELQEGQFWESLPSAVHRKMGELVVIVDHNKIQSDTWVRNVNDLGDLEKKFAAFGWHVARCDGHDLGKLAEVLAGFRKIGDRPKIILADTVKGRGVSFMEHSAMSDEHGLYKFHSGAPGHENYRRALEELIADANAQLQALGATPLQLDTAPEPARTVPQSPQRLIAAYAKALVAQADSRKDLVVLDADLMLDCGLIPFKDKYPDRFVECGIAEQDMVSMAGGLAVKGMLPVVHSFACFLSTRPNEQIFNNSTEKTRVIYVGSLAGLVPSGPGHSHQSVRDIANVASVPGMVVFEPSCEAELEQAFDYLVNRMTTSIYLRLISIPVDINFDLPTDYKIEPGKGCVLKDGSDAVIVAYGPVLLKEAMAAAKSLERDSSMSVKVINMPWLNRIDVDWLWGEIGNAGCVVTLDNHVLTGGLGQTVGAGLCQSVSGKRVRLVSLGLEDVPACGTNDEILAHHRLSAQHVAQAVRDVIL